MKVNAATQPLWAPHVWNQQAQQRAPELARATHPNREGHWLLPTLEAEEYVLLVLFLWRTNTLPNIGLQRYFVVNF